MADSFAERLKRPRINKIPEESLIPENMAVSKLTFVKKYQEEGHAFIDQMTHYHRILKSENAARAKNHIDAAVRAITGTNDDNQSKKRLSDRDQMQILGMITGVIKGVRPFILLQLNASADGIIESHSQKEFKFIDEKERRTNSK